MATGNNPSAYVADSNELYLRKCSLLLVEGDNALDLSDFRITFDTKQEDQYSPNSCSIRVYNLAADTVKKIKGEYSRVVLQAGYNNSNYGVVFDGTIRQWRTGREDATTTYLDILAADGDVAYNFAMINQTVAAGSTSRARIATIVKEMSKEKVKEGNLMMPPNTGGVLPRGKVLFGLARASLIQETESIGATWNIDNGVINIIPLDGYLPGEAVILTSASGLLGRAEQTQEGVKARCLINPRIVVGGLVKIDNKSINQTEQQKDHVIPGGQLAYNQYAGFQRFADVTADGIYRVYVAEYQGDTRGLPWWMDLVLLAVDPVSMKVKTFG